MLRLMLMSIVMLSYQLLSLTEKLASVSCCFSAKVHPVYWQGFGNYRISEEESILE